MPSSQEPFAKPFLSHSFAWNEAIKQIETAPTSSRSSTARSVVTSALPSQKPQPQQPQAQDSPSDSCVQASCGVLYDSAIWREANLTMENSDYTITEAKKLIRNALNGKFNTKTRQAELERLKRLCAKQDPETRACITKLYRIALRNTLANYR